TPRETAVELCVDQGDDIDPVDEQGTPALQQPRGVDLHPGDLAAAHDDLAQVTADEPRLAQRPVAKSPAPQLLGLVAAHGSQRGTGILQHATEFPDGTCGRSRLHEAQAGGGICRLNPCQGPRPLPPACSVTSWAERGNSALQRAMR